jgi:hypothetical protein
MMRAKRGIAHCSQYQSSRINKGVETPLRHKLGLADQRDGGGCELAEG